MKRLKAKKLVSVFGYTMKPRLCIISTISAVLMIVLISTQAIAVHACEEDSSWTTVNVQLDSKLDGQAIFTSEKNHTAAYSAKLVIPSSAREGSSAYALYAYNSTLNSIDTISFYVAYTNALPRLFIALDKNNDSSVESILLSDYKQNCSCFDWRSISADNCNGWTESNYELTNYGVNWTSLDYWKEQYGNATVPFVGVCLEYWAVEPNGFDSPLYTDKLILNNVYHTIVPISAESIDPSPTPTPTPNATVTPTPTALPKTAATLNVTSSSYLDDSRFRVDIKGTLTGNGTAISGVPISIFYSLSGGSSWNELTYITTEQDGSFSAQWFPTATGNLLIKAIFSGDTNYSETRTIINLAIAAADDEEDNVFSVSSNSTVSQLVFNSETNELSFAVSGDNGTTGYFDVFIPKTLVEDVSNLKVCLDGNQVNYTTTTLTDSWVLHLTYHHSEHRVTMTFDTLSMEPTNASILGDSVIYPTIAAIAIAIIISCTLLIKREKATKQ